VAWLVCIAAPIVFAMILLVPTAIAAGLWGLFFDQHLSSTTVERGITLVIVLMTLLLLPTLSDAIVRMSLRLSPLPIGTRSRFQLAPTLWLSWLLVLIAFVAVNSSAVTQSVAVIMGISCMARVYYFRHRWEGFPRGRTILFLRRFGRSADRLVSSAIRRAVPDETRLALLVGSRQGLASWDPVVVSFDGLATALPHYLRSTNDEWAGHVREMVARADAVVLDATDWSEAMDTELAIVDASGASGRLIVLERAGQTAAPRTHAMNRVLYRASWRHARDRILFGSFLTLVPAVFGESLGWSIQARVLVSIPAVMLWLLLGVRPVMDPTGAAELTRQLASLAKERPQEAGSNRFS
jgi:hypothetical protein